MSKQACKPYVKGQVFKYAHIKRDGHYTNVVRHPQTGKVHLFSSNPNNITEELRFLNCFEAFHNLPGGVSLIGELWLPGKRAADIKTAIKEQNPNLQWHCFAILHWPNVNVNIDYLPLQHCRELIEQVGLRFVPFVNLPNMVEAIALMGQIAKGVPDVEGLVFKNGNLADWHKWKPRKTIDLIIKGFQQGQGKYLNEIGAIVCKTSEGFEVANVSGMTDIQRQYMTQNADALIGKVIEVEYQDVGNHGRLRHPVFKCWRDDKPATDCNIYQDDELAQHWLKKVNQPLPLFD